MRPILYRIDGCWIIGILADTMTDSTRPGSPHPTTGLCLTGAVCWSPIITAQGAGDWIQSLPHHRIWIARDRIAASADLDDRLLAVYQNHMMKMAGIILPHHRSNFGTKGADS